LRFKETVLGSTGLGCLFLHDCILYHIIPYQRCVSRHSGAQQNSLYTIALFFSISWHLPALLFSLFSIRRRRAGESILYPVVFVKFAF
jgi:hypothetical protein